MEFSRQKHRSGLSFPSPGALHDPGIELRCPTLQADTLPSEPSEKPKLKKGTAIVFLPFSSREDIFKEILIIAGEKS